MFIQHLLYMRVDRESIHLMQCKKTDAVRDLPSDPGKFQKIFPCPAIFHLRQLCKRNVSGCDHPGTSADISATITELQLPQFFLRSRCEGIYIRECIICRSVRLPALPAVPLAQGPDQPFDPADIILLGQNERDDHLPCILLQNTNSAPELCRFSEILIFSADLFQIAVIICPQIKIILPEILILLFRTGKDCLLLSSLYPQPAVPGDQLISIPARLIESETLP